MTYYVCVSDNGQNIQMLLDRNNNVIVSDNVQALIPLAKSFKQQYPEKAVSIIDNDINSIEMDFQ